jgi:hypothetical protein
MLQELSALDLVVLADPAVQVEEEENAPRASIGSSNASTITEDDLQSRTGDTTVDENLNDALGGKEKAAATTTMPTTNNKAAPPTNTIRPRGLRSSIRNASSIATTPGF